MKNAAQVTVSVFGTYAGLAGIEHGVGEMLQGNKPPTARVILSWPESALFRVLGGEPAFTIVPNLLLTGILAILLSVIFIVWATRFVQRKNGGWVLVLLSAVWFLAGGGFAPPLLGLILGLAATRINAPLAVGRALGFFGKLWPWALGGGALSYLLLCPGTMLLDYYLGVSSPALLPALFFGAMGGMLLAIVGAFARDGERQTTLHQATAMMSRRPA
jgi:hypothetical protein